MSAGRPGSGPALRGGIGTTPPAGQTGQIAAEDLDDDRTIRRLVFNLAWPVIVENLLQTAVGVVDLLMVSRLGAAAIAGVGVSVQVLFVVFAAIMAIATGTTVLVSRFTGANQPHDATRVLKQSILMAVALGVFLAVVGVPSAKPLVALLGADPDVVELGGGYLQVVFLTSIALTTTYILGAALRGAGDSRTPMYVAFGINVVNVVVSYILIFGELGFPAMGVVGSAWGSAVGRILGAVALVVLVAHGVRRTGITLVGRQGWSPDPALLWRLLRIGLPSMAEGLSRSVGMLLFSAIVISLGTAVFAAQRITFNVISLSFLPGFGFAMAATALTGQALGAGKPDRARRATWLSVRSAALWMSSMGVLFLIAAPWFMRVFTPDPEIVAIGAEALRVMALGQPAVAVSFVLAGGLRGAGDTRFPMLNTTIGMWLIRLPLAWFFVSVLGWGLSGAYAAFVAGPFVEAVTAYLRYRSGNWQHLKV
ncbi:MAG TPA: MATE family efflux transporter [Chloroflexota bacterium]|nr:MATE family efflux transporter [Chloroflexota bacterium]